MKQKAMSQAMYIVIALLVMLIVAAIVLSISKNGLESGGGTLLKIITDTKIPDVNPTS